MNKFMITRDVNTKLIDAEDVLWPGSVTYKSGAILWAIPFIPGGLPAVAAARVIKALKDNSVTKITSIKELRRYQNCIANEWKNNVLYVEHPHRRGVLIEAALYKDYILREMVADVSNYIMDRLNLSKLVIGLIVSGKGKVKAKVPVEQVNAEATLKCNLDKNYLFSVCDTHATPADDAKYVWVSQFPDIVSAVEHGAGKMEIRKKVSIDMDIGVGLGKLSADAGVKKDFEFYITYTKNKET